MTYKN